jgi:NADH-quinone oxidoreductase subunit M
MTLTDGLILLPLAGALVVWLAPLPRELSAGLAFLVALGEVALWITTVGQFDYGDDGLQLQTSFEWFDDLGVSYHVGLFSWSLWLVGVSVVVSAAALGYALIAGRDRARAYGGLMLFLTGAVVAMFAAQDLLLFYVAFEAMLIPIYVLIGVWGGPGRLAATLKFVIYTMAGSLLMLAAIVAYGIGQGTFSLVEGGTSDNVWIFLGFAIAFAVKAPLFPFHGWLLDTYRESTPELAAVLSGVVSKAAVYGFIRVAIAKFPEPADDFTVPILVLAAIGLAYGSLLAFRAPDLRGVLAYSSMAQMGLIVLGIFAFNDLGLDGAILQAVNHGLVSGTLFLLAAMIERRTSTGEFALLGGMAKGRPALATLLMTTGIIALAVPGATTFAGEFAILAGVFDQGWGYAAIGAAAIVLAAMYVLRAISGVLHQSRGPAVSDAALDLRPAELMIVVPLVVCLLGLSAWPALVSDHAFPTNAASAISEALR